MAQHYPLIERDEPKIFASVKRIGKYLNQAIRYEDRLRIPYTDNLIYTKTVMPLGSEYIIDDRDSFVFLIGNYTLKSFGKENKELTSNVILECHFDLLGNIVNIYFVA